MVDPVMNNRKGHSYERATIVEWIGQSSQAACPLTRAPIKIYYYFANRYWQKTIQTWRNEYGEEAIKAETDAYEEEEGTALRVFVDAKDFRPKTQRMNKQSFNSNNIYTFGLAVRLICAKDEVTEKHSLLHIFPGFLESSTMFGIVDHGIASSANSLQMATNQDACLGTTICYPSCPEGHLISQSVAKIRN